MKIIGIIGTVLILGLILKDAQGFNTVMSGLNSTITALEKAGLMELSWRDYVRLYAPFAIYLLIVALGGLYALGYRSGISSLLSVSGRAASEAKCGS